ncbi:MAG: RNA polymerase sigma factor [Candidatus Gracilibacteria bacterium]
MNDLEIIKKCQEGDSDDFGILYDRYVDKIYNSIYLKTYNKEVSEDLTSDTFFKVLNKIDLIDVSGKYTFNSWIYKVAYNNIIDFYKTKKEELNIEDLYDLGAYDDVGKHIDDKDKVKEVFEYIKGLKQEHRDILIMRLWENLSYKEISEITGKSVDNCKQIFSRNMKSINADITTVLLILLFII